MHKATPAPKHNEPLEKVRPPGRQTICGRWCVVHRVSPRSAHRNHPPPKINARVERGHRTRGSLENEFRRKGFYRAVLVRRGAISDRTIFTTRLFHPPLALPPSPLRLVLLRSQMQRIELPGRTIWAKKCIKLHYSEIQLVSEECWRPTDGMNQG